MEQKILAHMNKDHKLALEDYLAVYGDVKVDSLVSDIKLKALEKDKMLISFKKEGIDFEIEKPIAIDPPMKDIASEARTRLVDMAKKAAAKRGYLHIQIKEVVYPNKFMNYVILGLVYVMIFAFFKPHLFYVTFLQNYLKVSPHNSVLVFLKKYNSEIFYATLVAHIGESMFWLMPKLRKYRVPTDIKLEWLVACLFEGFGAIRRFNELTPKE